MNPIDEAEFIPSARLVYVETPFMPGQFNAEAFLKILTDCRVFEKMNDFFLSGPSLSDLFPKRKKRCK